MSEFQSREEAIAAAFASQQNQPVIEQVKTEPVVDELIAEGAKVDLSDSIEEPKEAESVENEQIIEDKVISKTFEELLEERTGGKFKSWDEVEKIVTSPKEELDEEVRHWNNLKKSGVKLDKEFFELQNLNFGKLDDPNDVGDYDDPRAVLFEEMKRKPENNSLSNDTIKYQIEKKYNLREWEDKDEADLTFEDKANRDIMTRDARLGLVWLKKYKSERMFSNPINKVDSQKQIELQNNFDKFVNEELYSKVKNISIITDDKTKGVFDYKFSEADRLEAANFIKSLTKDGNALINRYKETDSQGNVTMNHQKFFVDQLKAKTFDEAVKHAYNDGRADGEKKFVKEDLKNVNFKASEGKVAVAEPKTREEAIARAIEQGNIKI